MKTVFLIIIFFTIGLFSGKYLFSTNEVIVRSETIPIQSGADKKLDSMSNAFFNLTQKDFLEYTNLKDQKSKYLKADEILSKIILIFLANVQMRMNPAVKSYFVDGVKPELEEKKVYDPDTALEPDLQESETKDTKEFMYKKHKVKNEQFQVAVNKLPIEIISPYAFFKKAKAIVNLDRIKKFNGTFRGNLLIETGKNSGQIHDVELIINFNQEGQKIKGAYESKLSFKGQLYSHNRGSGDNGQIRRGEKGLYLLETSPSSFMHLKYIEGEDYFVGKYYNNDEYSGLVKIYPIN
jgi:hypothetical protein